MSDSTLFDSHRHVKELTLHGLAQPLAETIVNVVQDGLTHHVATKSDFTDFRIGMQEQLAKLDGRLTALDGRVTNIEANMATKVDLANLRTDMESWKNELTWRLLGGFTAIGSLMVAATKLL